MRKLLFLLLLPFLIQSSCEDDPIEPMGAVNVNLKALYNGAPLLLYNTYDYYDGQKMQFKEFNFFISDIALLKADGSGEVQLIEVDFANFEDNLSEADAKKPLTFQAFQVPAGDYKGVRFSMGVPEDDNDKDAANLPVGNALRDNFASHYWTDWQTFIFWRTEGIYDLDGNGTFNADDQGFQHHCGKNDVYQTATITKNITVTEGQTLDMDFAIDIYKMYADGAGYIHLEDPANKFTHDPNNLTLAKKITGNFSNALSLE